MYIVDRDGLIALHQIVGVGWHTVQKLMEAGWACDNVLSSSIVERVRGVKIPSNTIKNIQEKWTPSFALKVKEELREKGGGVLTILDEEYPPLLKEIAQPPWVIYYLGDVSVLKDPSLAMVGTRRPTPYGLKVTQQLARQLADTGWVIVSGMANGIDGVAHRSVLNAGGKTVAVLGCGVDVVYPKNHRTVYEELICEGLVISEMPPGTRPHPGLFPQRNRIISGLCHGTIVVEAAMKSGSLITANFCVEEGRDVFAVPGPITSDKSGGTNQLIQQGAKCICTVEDITEEFPWFSSKQTSSINAPPPVAFTEQEKTLLEYIDMKPIQITNLIEKVAGKLSIGEIHQYLLSLETKGAISQLPGTLYVRV